MKFCWKMLLILAVFGILAPTIFLLSFNNQQIYLMQVSKHIFYEENEINLTVTTPFAKDAFDYSSILKEEMLPQDTFLEVDARMKRRRQFLNEQCSKTGLDGPLHKPYAWEYIVNQQYHVIWCNIFKAASTSWMYNFNLMANYTAEFLDNTTGVPLELARKKYGRPTVEMIQKANKDSILFLIVRHPLERLASAYTDKIVHPWVDSHHDKLGKQIIKKYRKQSGEAVPVEKYPLFEEFISYVLEESKRGNLRVQMDQHWVPYTDFCTPCKFEVDVILKFETLDEDQRYLIQLAKLQNIVKPERKNSFNNVDSAQTINSLYSRITRNQLDKLRDLYKYDLQLFNYTVDSFYEIVKQDDEKR